MPEELVFAVLAEEISKDTELAERVCRDQLGATVIISSELADSVLRESDLAVLFLPNALNQSLSLIDRLRLRLRTKPLIAVSNPELSDKFDVLCETHVDDLLTVPLRADVLKRRIEDLVTMRRLDDVESLKRHLLTKMGMDQFVGQSHAFLSQIRQIPRMSRTDATVLVMGETGVGKELCARAIHYLGSRAGKPFIPVNCGGIPDHLFENELFGHVRGAFTDAREGQKGLIDEANGGTLFLDEVDTLSLSAQIKLLRFLEDKRYKPLGSSRHLEADVRIITASNVDLRREINRGSFRQDLFYRVNVLSIRLPPLRERPEDIPVLAQHFLETLARQHSRSEMRFSNQAIQKLFHHTWPGNVRELKNVIEHVVTISVSNIVRPEDIPLAEGDGNREALYTESFQVAKRKAIAEFEKAYLQRVLAGNDWNISSAARQAGSNRRLFQRLIEKHGLSSTGPCD